MAIHIRRREFLVALGGAAAGRPLAARAQRPSRARRIGVLMAYAEGDRGGQAFINAFREELRVVGVLSLFACAANGQCKGKPSWQIAIFGQH